MGDPECPPRGLVVFGRAETPGDWLAPGAGVGVGIGLGVGVGVDGAFVTPIKIAAEGRSRVVAGCAWALGDRRIGDD